MEFISIMNPIMKSIMNSITHDGTSSWITMCKDYDAFHHDFEDEIHDGICDEISMHGFPGIMQALNHHDSRAHIWN